MGKKIAMCKIETPHSKALRGRNYLYVTETVCERLRYYIYEAEPVTFIDTEEEFLKYFSPEEEPIPDSAMFPDDNRHAVELLLMERSENEKLREDVKRLQEEDRDPLLQLKYAHNANLFLKEENEKLRDNIQGLKRVNNHLKGEVEPLQILVAKSQKEIGKLKEENKTLRENLCQLERVHKESDSAHLAGQVNDILHANTEAYRKRSETLQGELKALQGKLYKAVDAKEVIRQENEKLGEDCDIATTLNCVLQEEVNKLRETVKENKQFKEDYKMIAGKYDVAFNEIARLKKEVERLQAMIVEQSVRQKARIHQLAREMLIPIGDNRSIKVSFEEINE